MTVYRQAQRLVAAGLSIIPIRADGTKRAAGSWKAYGSRLANDQELQHWFGRGTLLGLAVVGGAVSGHVEVIDCDGEEHYHNWRGLVARQKPLLLLNVVITKTPRPGYQIWYLCPDGVGGNQKLARRPTEAGWETLIETRGEGGYAIIPPSPRECHPSGRPYEMVQGDLAELPTLTAEERDVLLSCGRALNQYVEPERTPRARRCETGSAAGDGERPGDEYNRRGDWHDLLTRHGWHLEHRQGDVEHWRRPGKEHGTSATLHGVAPGIFYVFSSNAAPFEAEHSWDLFGAYALLMHKGDFAAATRALRAQGFGSPLPERSWSAPPPDQELPPAAADEAPWEPAEGPEFGDEDVPPGGGGIKPPSADKLAREWAASASGQFLFAEGDQWCEYQGTHWTEVSDSTVETQIYHWLKTRCQRRVTVRWKLIKDMASIAAVVMGDGSRPVPRSRFDQEPALIPLLNGLFDLRERRLLPHSADRRNTYCLPYAYDPQADCPRFRQFLQETLRRSDGSHAEDWAQQLVEWMGYCLVPQTEAHTVLINVGEGGNGKSVWCTVLERLVGDTQCTALDPKQLTDRPEYALANLSGKLVAFMNEPSRMQLQNCTGLLKAIVSGDQLAARHPHGRTFALRPYSRIVMSCNEIPSTKDMSGGFWRRLLIIEWRWKPEQPDRRLHRKLIAELPGIFNMAIEGLDRVRDREWEFEETEESRRLKAEYRLSQDTVQQFLEAECDADPTSAEIWCLPMVLYRRYAAWAREAGYTPLSLDAFGKSLTKAGFPPVRTRRAGGGEGVFRVRYGVIPRGMLPPTRWEDFEEREPEQRWLL